MPRRSSVLAAFAVAVLATFSRAQVTGDLTTEQVKDAIDNGTVGCHTLLAGTAVIGCYTTPYSRVAGAALAAKKAKKPFSVSDVTTDLIVSDELHVHGLPSRTPAGRIANVVTVVVQPRGGQALPPAKLVEGAAEQKAVQGRGLSAGFPVAVLKDGLVVRVVYDADVATTADGKQTCRECSAEVKLAGVK